MTHSVFFSGSSHPALAQEVVNLLGFSLGSLKLETFPDGEIRVQLLEDVRDKEVFFVQSLADNPNFYLMELLILMDAAKRALAKSITVVIPYLAYCRQDRKDKPGVPITAKLVANLLQAAGASHVLVIDLHADQVEGFFEIPVEHLHFEKIIGEALRKISSEKWVVVSPDIGGVKIARRMSKILATEMVLINKERLSSFEVSMVLIGDVKGKNVLIIDDLCSTGGTLVAAAELCKKKGAKKIFGAVAHGLFVQDAIKKIEASSLELLFTTNTVDTSHIHSSVLQRVSIAPLIAETLKNRFRR